MTRRLATLILLTARSTSDLNRVLKNGVTRALFHPEMALNFHGLRET